MDTKKPGKAKKVLGKKDLKKTRGGLLPANEMILDDTAGGAEASGQATGKRQHLPIRMRMYD